MSASAHIPLTPSAAAAIVTATTCDIFNTSDQPTRRSLMEKHWSPSVTCYSPFGIAAGFDGLDQVYNGTSQFTFPSTRNMGVTPVLI